MEIEISDEMIEAGIEALELWDFGDLPEWKVASVYKAMELVHRVRRDRRHVRLGHAVVLAQERLDQFVNRY